jgi:hypothetical protein
MVLVGTVITPVLLPFIPGRAFAFKGGLLGLIWAAFAVWGFNICYSYLLILPSISAYLAMNFTGASTYTSPSGVLKEMKISLPFIIGGVGFGVVLLMIGRYL